MTIRRLLIAAVILMAGVNASAALSPQNEAWGKSAVIHLFTDEDAAAWKAVRTDVEAQAFIDLFWARRDPTPATPKNEFRERVEALTRYADEKFTSGRKKIPGSLTDRGMMLIVFGQPHRMANQHAQQQLGDSASAGRLGVGTNTSQGVGTADLSNVRSAVAGRLNSFQVWLYEGEATRQLFGVPRAEFTFVDRTNTEEYGLERGGPVDVAHWRKKVAASYITQPGLTKAPEFTSVPMGGGGPMGMLPAAAPVVTALTTPALASAVTELKAATANPYASNAYATYGEFITAEGEYFVPVLLYVPKTSPVATASDLTFFGVIEDESGKSVLAFEEPARLTASKDDFFVDKSLALPAGKHRGYFGLASGGKTVALVPADLTLAGSLDKSAAAVSSLILSNNIYPLSEPQRPTDPFAFGGTKVIPKSDKVFRSSSDELWYFFEIRNPGLAEGAPKIQVKVDITGTTAEGAPVKKSAPLAETQVMEVKGVAGHWAVGNAFPLTSFKPGDYTIAVKAIDTISKQTYTLTDKFKVVQ